MGYQFNPFTGNVELVLGSLDVEAAAADAIATAADRVQTGLDAQTSTTKAAESLSSANSAEQSYQSILALGNFNFDGGNASANYGGSTGLNCGGAS